MKNVSTTTKHQIGKITYLITASASENAKETIDKKVEKLILKDIKQNAAVKS